jgi:hypothetical protein
MNIYKRATILGIRLPFDGKCFTNRSPVVLKNMTRPPATPRLVVGLVAFGDELLLDFNPSGTGAPIEFNREGQVRNTKTNSISMAHLIKHARFAIS